MNKQKDKKIRFVLVTIVIGIFLGMLINLLNDNYIHFNYGQKAFALGMSIMFFLLAKYETKLGSYIWRNMT